MAKIGTAPPSIAKHGEKMIQISVRFWTDGIANVKGEIIQKHAWSHGVVNLETNHAHNIRPNSPIPFNSLMELPTAVEKVLIRQNIVLHSSSRMAKYIKPKL